MAPRHSGERRNPGLDPGFRRGDGGLYRLSTDRKWGRTYFPRTRLENRADPISVEASAGEWGPTPEALEAFPGLFYERPAECDRATVVLDGAGPVLED